MSASRAHQQRLWRASLRIDSLLSFDEAVEALPCPAPLAQSWLAAQPAFGCIHQAPVYRWGDLVELVRAGEGPSSSASAGDGSPRAWLTTAEVVERLGINRSTLDEMVASAPRDLTGAPIHVGTGLKKRHLRWDVDRIDAWFAAFEAWQRAQDSATGTRARPAAPKRTRGRTSRPARSVLAIVGGPSE